MALIIPALFLIFAATFAGLSLKFAALRYLRHIGLAFLLCGIGIFVQTAWWPAHSQANALIATAAYLAGAQFFAQSMSRRSGRTLGMGFHLAAFSLVILATAWFLFVSPHLLARTYILNFSFGAILLYASWQNRHLARGNAVDKAMLWTFILIGAHFFPRTLLTAASFQAADSGYSATVFWVALQYSITLLGTIGAIALLVITGADILASLKEERDTDPLTGLLNRRGLEGQVDALVRARGLRAAVILADLDNFKAINDTHGHAGGDQVLQTIADRLLQVTRMSDIVARIGGEEFVFVITAPPEEAAAFAERVREAVEREPVTIRGASLEVTASFGVAAFDRRGNFWDAVKNADAALYAAKRAGRNTIRLHRSERPGQVGSVVPAS